MKKLIIIAFLLIFAAMPVKAAELTAPEAPSSAQDLMPATQSTFGEDLWYVVKKALGALEPDIATGCGICLAVMAAVLLCSMLGTFPGASKEMTELAGCTAVACLVFSSATSMIASASETIQALSDYGKLLLPVMTTATAAQGAPTTATALYTGTALFNALLSAMISGLLTPMVYVYIALSVAKSALGNLLLAKLQGLTKWLSTWSLKVILYVFTGYITVTGVVSGTTDQSVLKATKLTISGMVPVVGNILSDASEAVLVGAGTVKNAVGIYGLLAILAIALGPFFKIGIQYLLLKLTAAVCSVFGSKSMADLVGDLSGAMGILLAMTGTICLMLLISVVCFMKGVS